jgi:hypothetical protein
LGGLVTSTSTTDRVWIGTGPGVGADVGDARKLLGSTLNDGTALRKDYASKGLQVIIYRDSNGNKGFDAGEKSNKYRFVVVEVGLKDVGIGITGGLGTAGTASGAAEGYLVVKGADGGARPRAYPYSICRRCRCD